MRIAHNVPPDDIGPHNSQNCQCKPSAEVIPAYNLVIFWHRSWLGIKYIQAIETSMGMRCECGGFLDERGRHVAEPAPYFEY